MKNGKKVISFSLWGNEDKYCIGAIRNVQLQELIYPGWICRFYIDVITVPHELINRLDKMGCEIILRKNEYYGLYASGKFWRHSVMVDSSVDRFIVRDADSRLSLREKKYVDQWIKSGKTLHIMRDHPHHGHRIMGGMWGGVNDKTRDLNYEELLETFLKRNNYYWKKKRQMDQRFLAEEIYPRFKDDMVVHDGQRFFPDEYKVRFATEDYGKHFIGQIYDVK